jgi:hypothetical protein
MAQKTTHARDILDLVLLLPQPLGLLGLGGGARGLGGGQGRNLPGNVLKRSKMVEK